MAWRVDHPGKAKERFDQAVKQGKLQTQRKERAASLRSNQWVAEQMKARERRCAGRRHASGGAQGPLGGGGGGDDAPPPGGGGRRLSPPGHVEAVEPFPGEPVEAGDFDPGPAAPDVARRIPQGVQATGGARGRGGSASGERVHCVHVP